MRFPVAITLLSLAASSSEGEGNSLLQLHGAKSLDGDDCLYKKCQTVRTDDSADLKTDEPDGTASQVDNSLGDSLGSSFGGDEMERQTLMYNKLPVGEDALSAAGWTKHDTKGCDPFLGFGWTEDKSGVTKQKPLKMYTTAGGQPSGIGVVILSYQGQYPLPEPQQQWATQTPLVSGVEGAHIDVAFRAGSIMCSGFKDGDKVGNALIVNPKGQSKHISLFEDGVRLDGWHRGSCFDGMGWHNFFDTSLGNGQMSGRAGNLFPVTTMYHKGKLNAIFFTSTINQISIPFKAPNGWDAKPLTIPEMCGNTCDSDCRFDGLTSAGPFSTMHVYFSDHKEVTCEAGLTCRAVLAGEKIACCAGKADSQVLPSDAPTPTSTGAPTTPRPR